MTGSDEDEVLTRLAVWYGDAELAVLVDWRNCRVVGLVRSNGDGTWTVRVYTTRWAAFRLRRLCPLETLGGGVFSAWYALPDRRIGEVAVMDVETFYPEHLIIPRGGA